LRKTGRGEVVEHLTQLTSVRHWVQTAGPPKKKKKKKVWGMWLFNYTTNYVSLNEIMLLVFLFYECMFCFINCIWKLLKISLSFPPYAQLSAEQRGNVLLLDSFYRWYSKIHTEVLSDTTMYCLSQ
jgi:hypothetical protein